MIDFNAITQTKAFARQDGVFLSMLWIVTFALVIYAPQTDLGGLLVFSTPLFVVWRMIKFRNYALDGVMSYRKALVYCIYGGGIAAVEEKSNPDFERNITAMLNAMYAEKGSGTIRLQRIDDIPFVYLK